VISDAKALSDDLAIEIAECARLIKGYSDTHSRGTSNFHRIEEALIRPALAGEIAIDEAVRGIAAAREAALADPDGNALSQSLAEEVRPEELQKEAAE
ncbi:MAG: hypothetical protein VX700_02850, partial [Pseudomonadota bacterium]|nr:hypothetical protein [Pseudomonadota bacterium]